MVGGHHHLNGHEFEQAPGVGDGQGGLACCCPWGHKEPDTTEQLNRCWFMLFPSEQFEATKESFFTIKDNAFVFVRYEDIKKKKKGHFDGLEKCFAFHHVKVASETACVV